MGTFLRVLLISICIVICGFYFDAAYFLTWPFEDWKAERLGQFGDAWGALTSIFSVAAFFGVLFSLKSQREASKQAEMSMKKQNESMVLQNFESNLFQMLKMHNSIINEVDIKRAGFTPVGSPERVERGRDAFHMLFREFSRSFEAVNWMVLQNQDEERELISSKFEVFYERRQQDLGHYFRFLYNIFRYLDESEISDNKKVIYAKIVRAQISNFELMLLFYSTITSKGENFTKYVNKYSLLDNMPFKELISKTHVSLIDDKAFGGGAAFEKFKLTL